MLRVPLSFKKMCARTCFHIFHVMSLFTLRFSSLAPRIQPFGSVDFSSLGKVYSRHVTVSVSCENSSVCFVMKYCLLTRRAVNPFAGVGFLIRRRQAGRFFPDETRSGHWVPQSCCGSTSDESSSSSRDLLRNLIGWTERIALSLAARRFPAFRCDCGRPLNPP